ncbi:MAG: response regulator [Anaerolineae bacterium]|nr:response regulator [Anaerolineae bacterium]
MATILIIEDNRIQRDFYSAILESTYRVVEATNAIEALTQAHLTRPDLVLLDLNLTTHHDGLAVCRTLRRESDPALAQVPIVVITGHDDKKTATAALAAGASSCVTKPIGGSNLLTLIEVLLAERGR